MLRRNARRRLPGDETLTLNLLNFAEPRRKAHGASTQRICCDALDQNQGPIGEPVAISAPERGVRPETLEACRKAQVDN